MKRFKIFTLAMISLLFLSSCENDIPVGGYTATFKVCMFVSDSNTDDFVKDSLTKDMLLDQSQYRLSVDQSGDGFPALEFQNTDKHSYNNLNAESDFMPDNESLSFSLFSLNETATPPTITYRWVCPAIFGDNLEHKVVLNLAYDGNQNWTCRATSATIDGNPLKVTSVRTQSNKYDMFLEYVIE